MSDQIIPIRATVVTGADGRVANGFQEITAEETAAAREYLGALSVVPKQLSKNLAGGAIITLTADEALNDILIFTGALTANAVITVPANAKGWTVLNSTTGAFSLTVKTPAGSGVTVAQGKTRTVFCDGAVVRQDSSDLSDAPTTASVKGLASNVKIDCLGINNYNCVVTADEVVLKNGDNLYVTVRAVNKTVNANGAVGAPLSIMAARAANTWLYRWLWYNVVIGLTATLDASNTAPTPPTGYSASDYNALLPGASRTDASAGTYLMQTATRGRRSTWRVLSGSNVAASRQMASGNFTGVTAVALGAFIPLAVATRWYGELGNQTPLADIGVAPNNSFSLRSGSAPPPVWQSGGSSDFVHESFSMEVEGANCYIYGNGGTFLNCSGWEE